MDVNLTISLMRGQMGVVIEKAVNAAVETVLGEMIRVVSLKFEEFRREMSAKERENQNIRNMLEVSRCQMKTMRRYVSALTVKEDRHSRLHQHRPDRTVLLQYQPAGRVSSLHHLHQRKSSASNTAMNTASNTATHSASNTAMNTSTHSTSNTAMNTSTHSTSNTATHSASNTAMNTSTHTATHSASNTDTNSATHTSTYPSTHSATIPAPCEEDLSATFSKPASLTADITWDKQQLTSQPVSQEPGPDEDYTITEHFTEEIQASRIQLGLMKGENPSAAVIETEVPLTESSDPLWSQTPPDSSEVEHTDTLDSGLLPLTDSSETFNVSTAACRASPFRIKQEEGEFEIVRVKEEPVEATASECPGIELCQQTEEAGPSISLDLPLTQPCPQISCPSITESGYIGVDPSTYAESQLAMASGQRQVRPWCKDLNLYEEYKRKRIEVRKRSETRRRELEQTLPQALLADLVKERREKTRLRVARWRAKRKLQACLMSQASQLNGTPPQGLFAQRGRKREGAAVQQGGFTLGRAGPSETGPYTLPLQIGSSPLLTAQRLGVADGQMQSGSSLFPQHRTPTSGSDMFQ